MKAILVFLLIAAVSANEIKVEIFEFRDGPTALDFLRGFLEAIDEKKSLDDMILCVKSVEEVIHKIIDALEIIKELDFKRIVEGITKLLAALKELSEAVKPCSEGYLVLQKLIKAIYNADFQKVLQKLLQNSLQLISFISTAIGCFQTKEFECSGKNIGKILKTLFLTSIYRKDIAEIDALDFIKGFLEGLGGKSDDKDLDKCIKDIEDLIEAIGKAFDAIRRGDIQGIKEGLKLIIQITKKFVEDLQHCTKDEIIQKLIKAIINFDLMATVWKIVSHLPKIIAIINKTLGCFETENYHCIGHGFGSFLKIALL